MDVERVPGFLGDSIYPVPDVANGVPPQGGAHIAAPPADGEIVILGDEDFNKFDALLNTNYRNR